jgi:hypothetical protein
MLTASPPGVQPALLSKLLQSNITDGIDWLLWIGAAAARFVIAAVDARLPAESACPPDSDAIFMDMAFELPLDEYAANGHNLVLWGEPRKVDTVAEAAPDYFGLNAGVMLLRNNAWTRAFLARILAAGDDIAGSTAVQGAALKGMCDRAYDCVVSDQSTIVWLLYSQPELWRAQTLLEKRFALNGCASVLWVCLTAVADPLVLAFTKPLAGVLRPPGVWLAEAEHIHLGLGSRSFCDALRRLSALLRPHGRALRQLGRLPRRHGAGAEPRGGLGARAAGAEARQPDQLGGGSR